MPEENKRCERSRQNDPHGAPGKSLPESDFVCTTMKDAEVQRQHGDNEHVEENPEKNQRVTGKILYFGCNFTGREGTRKVKTYRAEDRGERTENLLLLSSRSFGYSLRTLR